jgi:hypothetical protein
MKTFHFVEQTDRKIVKNPSDSLERAAENQAKIFG